jgi:hypothetical protein
MGSLRGLSDPAIAIKTGQPCCVGVARSIFRKYSDHEMFIST